MQNQSKIDKLADDVCSLFGGYVVRDWQASGMMRENFSLIANFPGPVNPAPAVRTSGKIKMGETKRMQVGKLIKGSKEKYGDYYNLELDFPLLRKMDLFCIRVEDKKNSSSPDYTVKNNGLQCGAIWKKSSGSGSDYLSIVIESPVFADGRIFLAGFFNKNDAEELTENAVVVWDRGEK